MSLFIATIFGFVWSKMTTCSLIRQYYNECNIGNKLVAIKCILLLKSRFIFLTKLFLYVKCYKNYPSIYLVNKPLPAAGISEDIMSAADRFS